jgi:hypothetical protein
MVMTQEDKDITQLRIDNAALTQRVNFLEKTGEDSILVHWICGVESYRKFLFVVINF